MLQKAGDGCRGSRGVATARTSVRFKFSTKPLSAGVRQAQCWRAAERPWRSRLGPSSLSCLRTVDRGTTSRVAGKTVNPGRAGGSVRRPQQGSICDQRPQPHT